MSTQQDNISWSNQEVNSLMDELENALSLMSPYYSQCNAGESAYQLLSTLRKKQDLIGPHFENVKINSYCSICNKDFGKSKKGKALSEEQQYNQSMTHLFQEHGIVDHKERKSMFIQPTFKIVEFKNRQTYLDSLN